MAIIKCKMCGGELVLTQGNSVAECEYCGSVQTVPTADNEKKLNLFARANRLRAACEFDKAAVVYESIAAEFPEEAEAYWGLVLCKYGIEYVDDPATGKKVPTCHRSSFDSVMKDGNFELAQEYADVVARRVYREEAKTIEGIRAGILEVSAKESPYDVFICYKETDFDGKRTLDSVLAQDLYSALTDKGYRVFFARISLEDKLGQQYEPYIFAALNSAKVMLVVGTDYEHFNAVWVKNEWSRFLKLMAQDKSKHLIPCFKGIDAYDMPEEFARLQAQDLGKMGATQDILHGLEKLMPRQTQVKETVVVQTPGVNVDALLKRGQMALEDGLWDKAEGFFDEVLNHDAECARAYLGLAMAEVHTAVVRNFVFKNIQSTHYQRAKQFADPSLLAELTALEKEAADFREAERKRQEELEAARLAEEKARREAGEREREEERQARIARLAPIRERNKAVQGLLSCGHDRTVGLKSDGTAVAEGLNCGNWYFDDEWTDIIALSTGYSHIVGLKSDGTVVAKGSGEIGPCKVSGWRDIVAISAGARHTVGLKSDGTVVATKYTGDSKFNFGQCNVSAWTDIVAISAGNEHTIGLKSDGTVVAVGNKEGGRCNVSEWTDIVAVSAEHITVGLKSDGTVVAVGHGYYGECNVSEWTDIVAVSAGTHTVGLKSDGTVVTTGLNNFGQCDVSKWTNIVAISAGTYHTAGLKSNGTVVAMGCNDHDRCNVFGWKLFQRIDTIEQERKKATEKRREEEKRKKEQEERERQMAAWRNDGKCQHCGGELKGLFTKKCVSCGKAKDY